MSDGWFERVSDGGLEQGDLVVGAPVIRASEYTFPLGTDAQMRLDYLDVIVLTQTCDLENSKVADVLVALVRKYTDLVAAEGAKNAAINGTKWRTSVRQGEQPPYTLIPFGASEDAPYALVDFHHLFTLPKAFLLAFTQHLGSWDRLQSPYKEHLAQSFARYMMRVGLPDPLSDFDKASAS